MESAFYKHMSGKYPHIDMKKAFEVFDSQISEVQLAPNEENTDLRLPLGCDLNRNIVIKCISDYNADRYSLGDRVTTEYYQNEVFEVVGIRKDELELKGDWSGGTHNVSQTSWYPTEKCKKS